MKTVLMVFTILLLSNLTIAQTTAIPDANFEQKLIGLGFDNIIDGVVLTANIDTITHLDVGYSNIVDLTGIEDFTALTHLDCEVNDIVSLDLSQNLALHLLEANTNLISSLDISQNLALDSLDVYDNKLAKLDVSHLPNLEVLWSDINLLTCLNLKNGNNSNFYYFSALSNPNLTCIEVDNILWSTSNWTNIDPVASFSTSCPNPCAVGIEENNLFNLSLYPNPTNGVITIVLGEVKQDVNTTLTNGLGQVILTENYTSTNFINLDINAPKGIYFLQLESNGEVITKKIIKE